MMKNVRKISFGFFVFLMVIFCFFACNKVSNQEPIQRCDLTCLENLKTSQSKPLIINFWATWCKPCIEELPYFNQLHKKYAKDIDVILISLDDLKDSTKVKDFVDVNKIEARCYLLDAGKASVWIDKVNKNWSGAIPASWFLDNGIQLGFYEEEFTFEKLENRYFELFKKAK